jgi:hypothetical protein
MTARPYRVLLLPLISMLLLARSYSYPKKRRLVKLSSCFEETM